MKSYTEMVKYTTVTITNKSMDKLDLLHTYTKKTKGSLVDLGMDLIMQKEGIKMDMDERDVKVYTQIAKKMLKECEEDGSA